MPKKQMNVQLDVELLAEFDAKTKALGLPRTKAVETALRHFLAEDKPPARDHAQAIVTVMDRQARLEAARKRCATS